MSNGASSNPVWNVYDEHRTARLNVRYYSALLQRLRKRNFSIELVLAITAPSSAVAALWLWETTYGSYVWKGLCIITALLAVAKPLLNLTDQIRNLEKLVTGYRALDHDLQNLSALIRQERSFTETTQRRFQECMEAKRVLVVTDTTFAEDETLLEKCYETVLRELPDDTFYVPQENSNEKK